LERLRPLSVRAPELRGSLRLSLCLASAPRLLLRPRPDAPRPPLLAVGGAHPGCGPRLRGGQRAAHHPGGIATPSGTLAAGAGGNAAHHPGGTATSPALDGGGPLLIGSSRGADDADEPLFPAWYTCPGFDAYGAAGGWCVHHAGGVDRDSDVVDRGRVLRVIGEEDQVSRSDL